MGRPAKKLVNLEVLETSGVDRAAHLHDGFLVMKSANEITRVKTQLLEALGKSKEDNLSSVQEQIDLAVAKAVGDYEEKVNGLEAALEAAKNQAADLTVKLEEIQAMQTVDESSEVMAAEHADKMEDVPEEVAKSIAALPLEQQDVMVKAFKAQAEEVRKATEEIRKERDIRLDAEAVAISKENYKNVGMDHETVAPAMRKLAEVNPTLAKLVEEVLMAADAQVGESGLMKEFGTSSTSSVSVLDEAKSLAKSLVESGTVKTIEQGIERVLDTNPDLAKRYAQEGAN
jgi:Cu/Ag efflux protein CusF